MNQAASFGLLGVVGGILLTKAITGSSFRRLALHDISVATTDTQLFASTGAAAGLPSGGATHGLTVEQELDAFLSRLLEGG